MANILIFDLWSLRARAPVTQPLSKAMTCTVVVVGDVHYLLYTQNAARIKHQHQPSTLAARML